MIVSITPGPAGLRCAHLSGRLCRYRSPSIGLDYARGLSRSILKPATHLPDVSVAAKGKKGGKKGGKGTKGPGSLMDSVTPRQPFENMEVVMLNLLMVESFKRNTGRIMLEDVEINNAAKEMWNADFAIIAYDRGVSESPKIQYANQAALDLIGSPWQEVYGTAAADFLDMDCNQLLEAHERGAISSYEGRFSTASKDVTITNADVWTIESPAAAGLEGEDNVDASNAGRGKVMGQGVVFSTWILADGSAGGVGMNPTSLPSPEEVADLETSIQEQGDRIRAMKESGLTNQDADVTSAVADLLTMKGKLAEIQALLNEA